jgi:hypothetical protein
MQRQAPSVLTDRGWSAVPAPVGGQECNANSSLASSSDVAFGLNHRQQRHRVDHGRGARSLVRTSSGGRNLGTLVVGMRCSVARRMSAILGPWVRAYLLHRVTMRRWPHRQPHTCIHHGGESRNLQGRRASSACQQAPSSAWRWPAEVVNWPPSHRAESSNSAAEGRDTDIYCRRAEASASATATTSASGRRRSSATR